MPGLLVDLRRHQPPADAGAKAAGLHWLAARGHAVPRAWALAGSVAAGLEDPTRRAAVRAALSTVVAEDRRYAVRSSADLEDGTERSFAGQFRTILDLQGVDAVLAALDEVVGSGSSQRLSPYLDAIAPGSPGAPAVSRPVMGIVVQELVVPMAAGVAFSKNPLTGLDEVVVEAIPGRGDRLMSDGETPERWVDRWGAWIEQPTEGRVPPSVIGEVVGSTRRIAAARGEPVDLEWAWDGNHVWWLQVRPITGLEGVRLYSNRISREVLPGLIKPLVWTVNVPVVNRAWIRLLASLAGPTDLTPDRLARRFGGRAYFEMGALGDVFEALGMPREVLELLIGLPPGPERPRFRPSRTTVRHVPRMLRVASELATYGPTLRGEVRDIAAVTRAFEAIDPPELDDEALIRRVHELMELGERAAYANVVTPLLMNLYTRLLDRGLAAAGIDPSRVDPASDRSDRHRYDPRAGIHALAEVLAALPPEDRAAIRDGGIAALADRPDLAPVRGSLDAFLERFGALADSGNDFSLPRWREEPDAILRMALDDPTGMGEAALGWTQVEPSVPAVQRPLLRLIFGKAGAYRVYREAISLGYTRAYGLFRPTFLEAGRRLADRGVLDVVDDVFYLELEELEALLLDGDALPARGLVATRRQELEEAADLLLPDLIFGDDFVPTRGAADGDAARIVGLASSRGHHRGRARVIRGLAERDRLEPGDVLVVPHSDVAWTPLFARASAVIAESGGMLSHASIVAREFGIPCVVSATGACSRIPDGAIVTVDGYLGDVVIEAPET
jgi:phosphohistidine swiveling domain-containing protein